MIYFSCSYMWKCKRPTENWRQVKSEKTSLVWNFTILFENPVQVMIQKKCSGDFLVKTILMVVWKESLHLSTENYHTIAPWFSCLFLLLLLPLVILGIYYMYWREYMGLYTDGIISFHNMKRFWTFALTDVGLAAIIWFCVLHYSQHQF